MEKEKSWTKEEISNLRGVSYDQKQTILLSAIADLLIDIRTLLRESKHGKA